MQSQGFCVSYSIFMEKVIGNIKLMFFAIFIVIILSFNNSAASNRVTRNSVTSQVKQSGTKTKEDMTLLLSKLNSVRNVKHKANLLPKSYSAKAAQHINGSTFFLAEREKVAVKRKSYENAQHIIHKKHEDGLSNQQSLAALEEEWTNYKRLISRQICDLIKLARGEVTHNHNKEKLNSNVTELSVKQNRLPSVQSLEEGNIEAMEEPLSAVKGWAGQLKKAEMDRRKRKKNSSIKQEKSYRYTAPQHVEGREFFKEKSNAVFLAPKEYEEMKAKVAAPSEFYESNEQKLTALQQEVFELKNLLTKMFASLAMGDELKNNKDAPKDALIEPAHTDKKSVVCDERAKAQSNDIDGPKDFLIEPAHIDKKSVVCVESAKGQSNNKNAPKDALTDSVRINERSAICVESAKGQKAISNKKDDPKAFLTELAHPDKKAGKLKAKNDKSAVQKVKFFMMVSYLCTKNKMFTSFLLVVIVVYCFYKLFRKKRSTTSNIS